MKNKILYLLTILCAFAIASCKKKAETCKLGKCYISDGNTTLTANTFYYYPDGRLKKITYTNKTKDSLIYNSAGIIINTFDDNNLLVSVFSGAMNAAGYVTSGTRVYYNGLGAVTSTDSFALTYNADGNLTQQVISNSFGASILNLNYLAGNSATGTFANGIDSAKKYTFYHSTAGNKTGIDEWNGVFTPYFGKPSKNLLDSVHITSATDSIRIQYAHYLDANDYVGKTIQTYLTHGVATKYFTYEYFDCSK